MDEISHEMFMMHSDTHEYREAVCHSVDVIRGALSIYEKPIISYSGGKDSLVMMHMVLEHDPEARIFHWDYGIKYMPRIVCDEIIDTMNLLSQSTKIIRGFNKCEYTTSEWMRYLHAVVFPELESMGFDLQFIGLREEESLKRKRKLNGNPFRKGKIDECHPLHMMSWKDVWAYIVSNDLPYLNIYDKYAELIGWDKVRFATFFDSEFDKLGASNVDGVLMPEFKHV